MVTEGALCGSLSRTRTLLLAPPRDLELGQIDCRGSEECRGSTHASRLSLPNEPSARCKDAVMRTEGGWGAGMKQ